MKRKKKVIVRGAILLIIAVIVVGIIVSKNNNYDGEKEDNPNIEHNIQNDMKKIEGTQKIGNLEITDIVIKRTEGNTSEIIAKIKNTSETYLAPKTIDINVIDKNGEVKEVFGGIITALVGYEENTFTTSVLTNILYAENLEFIETGTNE